MFTDAFQKALDGGALLTMTAYHRHLEMSDNDVNVYACIGKYVSDMADIEFSIDEFIVAFSSKYPKIALSIYDYWPIKIDDKINFITMAFVNFPPLRECGDRDGSLDLKFLYYRLMDIFDKRNFIIHGSKDFISISGDEFEIGSRKYTRLKKNSYKIDKYVFSKEFIEISLSDLSYIESLIRNGTNLLKGVSNPRAEREEMMKSSVRRKQFAERLQTMGISFG